MATLRHSLEDRVLISMAIKQVPENTINQFQKMYFLYTCEQLTKMLRLNLDDWQQWYFSHTSHQATIDVKPM